MDNVRELLSRDTAPSANILENRLQDLDEQILSLRYQQHTTIALLREMTGGGGKPVVDKNMWVRMMEAAGMNETSMATWHAEFERRAPKAHQEFLMSLGIPKDEVLDIREWSKRNGGQP